MNKEKYLLISGGTGGHVIPAVNFGNFIVQKGHNCYLFIDQRGMKYTSLFKGKLIVINSSHFSYNFFGKFKALISIILGFLKSLKYILEIRPSTCIAFGSYASFVPLTILSFIRIFGFTKIYLHEQNSIMGKVNILFTPFADKIFLNFKETLKIKKKYKQKTLFVGFPKNHNFIHRLRNTDFKNNSIKKVFICGGSQGAVNLNKKIMLLLMKIPRNILNRIKISIQCPKNQLDEIHEFFHKLAIPYDTRIFFDNFIEKLYQTDILIARAGAGTVSDVIITQTPTIFVPLPSAANQHQNYNANYLIDKKMALLIEEKNLSHKESLLTLIQLINNSDQQVNMIKNLQKIKNFDTNQLIYNHLNGKF